jgi:hypothetical protein
MDIIMKSKLTTLIFSLAIVVIIGITFYFLVQKNFAHQNSAGTLLQQSPATITVATTTANTAMDTLRQSSSTPLHGESIVEKKIELADGVIQEVRNEVLVKEWKHSNGMVVTLYEKDYFFEKDYDPAHQTILKVKKPNENTRVLLVNTPTTPRFGTTNIGLVEFSPKGNYVVVEENLYESSRTSIFDLKTGTQVVGNDNVYSLESAWPSWNADESKLLLLSSAYSIGGCEHCPGVWYSKTGSFTDVMSVIDLTAKAYFEEPTFGKTELKQDVLEIEVTHPDPKKPNEYSAMKTKAFFDFSTGKLSSDLKYLNN